MNAQDDNPLTRDLRPSSDAVAAILIQLHSNGGLAVSGNIGDVTLALAMLDHARDAVKNQLKHRTEIVVPAYDVEVTQHPAYPTVPAGEMR